MQSNKSFLVWDLPTRLFHWLIVILVFFSWYSVEVMEDLDKHFLSGYCALGLLLFRLTWGFLGTNYARFKNMLYSPAQILSYASGIFKKESTKFTGHNPLGSLSVFALLGVMLLQAVSGLFSNDEDWYFGPLSDYVSTKTADRLTEFHHLNFNVLLALIVLHILAVFFYLFFKKENLLKPMVTGKKNIDTQPEDVVVSSKSGLALVILIVWAAAVFLMVKFA